MNTTGHNTISKRIWGLDAGEFGPLIIAEIGTSHQGNISKARELIDAARQSGAECVKFQHVYADEIIHPKTGIVPLPGGETRLYDVFRSLETSRHFLEEIKNYAEKLGLSFLCTPFGERSLKDLMELHCSSIKIASPELNHIPLLQVIGKTELEIILSTGVSRLSDIDEALYILRENKTALLHCVTSYPAPAEDYNISVLPHLSVLFAVPVGISDHSLDPLLVPLSGLYYDAVCIEKHFTIDRQGGGLDDPVALTPEKFSQMSKTLQTWSKHSKTDLLDFLVKEYGEKQINAVFGNGRKILAPSEIENYGRTNRSIHATADILPGEVIDSSNIAVLRTEKELSPGLHPRYMAIIRGKTAKKRISDGEGIQWEDLI